MLYIVKDSFNSPQSGLVHEAMRQPLENSLESRIGGGRRGVQKSELDFGRGELN